MTRQRKGKKKGKRGTIKKTRENNFHAILRKYALLRRDNVKTPTRGNKEDRFDKK